jgi:uncharacterized membrane protein
MDELNTLASHGLSLPSPAYLLGAIFFGLVGYAAYRYGKKKTLSRVKWLGVALMIYPYAITATWLLYIIGFGLCVALYLWRE